MAIENSTGKVRAMVGGREYNQSPFNLATEGERQPGSSFKAFDLAAALEDGISPGSVWTSKPKTFKVPHSGEVFVVHNDENAYTGENTLTNATAYSDNSIYAEVGLKVGTHRIATLAHRMGITTPISTNPAMTIGACSRCHAAGHGTRLRDDRAWRTARQRHTRRTGMPVGIEEVSAAQRTLPDGHHRETDHTACIASCRARSRARRPKCWRPCSSTAPRTRRVPRAVRGGKTGTTSNYGDAWFVGWDSKYTVAVWVGFPNSLVPMTTEYDGGPVLGGTFPALIWHNFMVSAMHVEKQRIEEADAKTGARPSGATDTSTTEAAGEASGGGLHRRGLANAGGNASALIAQPGDPGTSARRSS